MVIDFSPTVRRPTDKQIEFADEIAFYLDIDFPRGDFDFTFERYQEFISSHVQEFRNLRYNDPSDEELDCYADFLPNR